MGLNALVEAVSARGDLRVCDDGIMPYRSSRTVNVRLDLVVSKRALIDGGAKARIYLAVIKKIPAIQVGLDMWMKMGIVGRNNSPLPRFSNEGIRRFGTPTNKGPHVFPFYLRKLCQNWSRAVFKAFCIWVRDSS